jgi:hypothetical protein
MIPGMAENHKKPGWAFWATVVAVLLPVLYVLSFGPACWITQCPPNDYQRIAPRAYWPIGDFYSSGKRPLANSVISWYAKLFGNQGLLLVPTDESGEFLIDL